MLSLVYNTLQREEFKHKMTPAKIEMNKSTFAKFVRFAIRNEKMIASENAVVFGMPIKQNEALQNNEFNFIFVERSQLLQNGMYQDTILRTKHWFAEEKPKSIYYAHHQWKYNTEAEIEELNTIKTIFENSVIINPNGWIAKIDSEEVAMAQCLQLVKSADILVFSCIEGGIIGRGVYTEIKTALDNNKKVYRVSEHGVVSFNMEDFKSTEIIKDFTGTNRKYAKINHKFFLKNLTQ